MEPSDSDREPGRPEATAHLCGAAEMYLQQIGSTFPKGYQANYRWYLAGIQTQSGAEDWARWWQEGTQLSTQQAISLAYQKSACETQLYHE